MHTAQQAVVWTVLIVTLDDFGNLRTSGSVLEKAIHHITCKNVPLQLNLTKSQTARPAIRGLGSALDDVQNIPQKCLLAVAGEGLVQYETAQAWLADENTEEIPLVVRS